MNHRRVNKRTGAIVGASAAAVAAAAILLPNANASSDTDSSPKSFAPRAAAQLGTTLAGDLGQDAAGWYFDGTSKRLVMNVLDEESAESVRAKGAVAKVVENSMAELKSATRTLTEQASVPGTAWSIDPRTNKVSVLADKTVTGSKMDTLNKAVDGMDGKVTVKRSAGEFKPFDEGDGAADAGAAAGGGAADAGADAGGAADAGAAAGGAEEGGGAADAGAGGDAGAGAGGAEEGGAAAGGAGDGGAGAGGAGAGGAGAGGDAAAGALEGGDAIFGGGSRCSLGFNVDVQGEPAFLTAGHCGNASETWTSDEAGAEAVGTVQDSQFPENDFALVKYDDAAVEAPSSVDLQDGTKQEITQAAEASVGMEVKRSGSTTGTTDGAVTGLDATVNYGNGDIVNGLIQTDVCAEPGDSGGAMFSGDSAVGLTSGGSGDCTAGGETFFAPVTAALEATGAQIGAGGGAGDGGAAAGGAEDGGAADAGAGDAGAADGGAADAGAGDAGAGGAGAADGGAADAGADAGAAAASGGGEAGAQQ
ncbi:S1 family peptidase [Streptomyces sp. NPDC004647]|uniref:S1 family peptidase n=1 Tax=Streptomyces sp. NPDC004647 TaxID=3154671 RepID=UPI0033AB41C8